MPSLSRKTTGNLSLLPTHDPVLGGALSTEAPSRELCSGRWPAPYHGHQNPFLCICKLSF